MMTHINKDEDEGADFEKKQAIWMLKEMRKSIRALAKTKGMDKSRVWKPPATNIYLIGWENNSSWWQTNKKTCENEP